MCTLRMVCGGTHFCCRYPVRRAACGAVGRAGAGGAPSDYLTRDRVVLASHQPRTARAKSDFWPAPPARARSSWATFAARPPPHARRTACRHGSPPPRPRRSHPPHACRRRPRRRRRGSGRERGDARAGCGAHGPTPALPRPSLPPRAGHDRTGSHGIASPSVLARRPRRRPPPPHPRARPAARRRSPAARGRGRRPRAPRGWGAARWARAAP